MAMGCGEVGGTAGSARQGSGSPPRIAARGMRSAGAGPSGSAAIARVRRRRAGRDGSIELVAQPIIRVERPDEILYRECRACLRLPDGRLLLPDRFLAHANQLGLRPSVDALVLGRAMATLSRGQYGCLGINLSPHSVANRAWWEPVLGELARCPELARRLVFEIQEAAVLVPGSGREFWNALRQAGCRVAIDGFGVRYGVQTAMEIDAPDIIKLDRSLLAGLTARRVRRLTGLVALAREMAPCVIVDGVASNRALQVVQAAGAQWAQGSLLGSERLIARRPGR
ncbi:hypothetical protein WL43_03375 [Burkholderia ubonensis]|nr:hypothetical protein WL43_03375 [Burkholderia ubonensis]